MIFGESSTDKRDYRMGLAGLLAGIHALRILAERGIASPTDLFDARQGIKDVLETIPSAEMSAEQQAQIIELIDKTIAVSQQKFRPEA